MEKKNGLLVINVLPKEYYDDCHIKGSVHVPLDALKLYVDSLDRSQPIVVYCAKYTCSASRDAWHMLDEMGFSNLWAYEGGIAEWKQAGLPTDGACSLEYLDVVVKRPEDLESQVKEISKEQLMSMIEESGCAR